jgi:hypothetical protein
MSVHSQLDDKNYSCCLFQGDDEEAPEQVTRALDFTRTRTSDVRSTTKGDSGPDMVTTWEVPFPKWPEEGLHIPMLLGPGMSRKNSAVERRLLWSCSIDDLGGKFCSSLEHCSCWEVVTTRASKQLHARDSSYSIDPYVRCNALPSHHRKLPSICSEHPKWS